MQKPQALDNSIVEIDQFRFGEIVDVDAHLPSPSYAAQRGAKRRGAFGRVRLSAKLYALDPRRGDPTQTCAGRSP